MCVCRGACAHPLGACPACMCVRTLCLRCAYALGEWRTCIHCVEPFACTCIRAAMCTVGGAECVCVYAIGDNNKCLYVYVGSWVCARFVCSPVGVCSLCWERWGCVLCAQAGMCTCMCLGEVGVCTRTVNPCVGTKGHFRRAASADLHPQEPWGHCSAPQAGA